MSRWWVERRREVWREVAERIGGRFVEAHAYTAGSDVVELRRGTRHIRMDSALGTSGRRYTRVRAVFHNPTRWRFVIRRSRLLDRLRRALGTRDIEIGRDGFDRRFVVRSPTPRRVRGLLVEADRLRRLLLVQRDVHVTVLDDELPSLEPMAALDRRLPGAVDLLYLRAPGHISEHARLTGLFELFETLAEALDPDDGTDPVVRQIRRLAVPGGVYARNFATVWDGDRIRRDAAQRLGRLGDARAVAPLVTRLDGPDGLLRAGIVEALGRIGDRRAVPALIPLLGSKEVVEERTTRGRARDALATMGAERLAESVLSVIRGQPGELTEHMGPYRAEIVQALVEALEGGAVGTTTAALRELGAVEAIGPLKTLRAERSASPGDARTRWMIEVLTDTIAELERRTTLPRPSTGPDEHRETLPRPASAQHADTSALPRPVSPVPDDST